MDSQLAHDIYSVPRTQDVSLLENVSFKDMFFSEPILKALTNNGFHKPSPIQYKAIPLGRCGFDLIVQSKSGTGKTLVFAITVLESIDVSIDRIQAVVLTPTREIALQVTDVFKAIGKEMKDFVVETFIGGIPLVKDIKAAKKCHVAIGAPGRIHQLIELGHLKTEAVRLLVLDEADQLMAKAFQNDINYIYWSLSEFKQMMALSATYPDELIKFLGNYMRSGQLVTPETDTVPVLKGLKQFVSLTRDHLNYIARLSDKDNRLIALLSTVKFNQCLIFSNYQSRAESTCNMLRCRGWPCEWISARQPQEQRIQSLTELKSGRCRLLVTTDLTARGIDSKGIDLVVNMDTPYHPSIYLHRMGRAGRYGSHGIVITILSRGEDLEKFQYMLGSIDMNLSVKIIPSRTDYDLWSDDVNDFDELFGIESEEKDKKSEEKYTPMEYEPFVEPIKSKNRKKDKKTKINKKNNRPDDSENNINLNNVEPPHPDLSEMNFPSISKYKNKNSLNDHFLAENGPGEFLSFSSLKKSLGMFEKNQHEVLNLDCRKDIDCVDKVSITINDSDLIEINSKLKEEINNDKVKSEKVKSNENIHKNQTIETAGHCIKINSDSKKAPATFATQNRIRHFSYSDITKGKRAECKPALMKTEEIERQLQKSPLKQFTVEKVCNKIEGVDISDKAINGFSKRMYSSVVKGRNDKMRDKQISVDNTNKVIKTALHFGNVVNNQTITPTFKDSNVGKTDSNQYDSSEVTTNEFTLKNVGELPTNPLNEPKKEKFQFKTKKSEDNAIISKQTSSSLTTENEKRLIGKNNDLFLPEISITKVEKPKSIKEKTEILTNGNHKVDKSTTRASMKLNNLYNKIKKSEGQLSGSIKSSDRKDALAKDKSFPRVSVNGNSSINEIDMNGDSFYEFQTANLSRISPTKPKRSVEVTFDESSTSESSDSEGEYNIISGSISNNLSVPLNRLEKPSTFRRRDYPQFEPYMFSDWVQMFYHQRSAINSYVQHAKHFHLTNRR